MDYSIPLPIKIREEIYYYNKTSVKNYDYECICKYCKNYNKYLTSYDGYSYLYNKCLLCNKDVWYYPEICSLYGRRSPYVVCFYCRIPYYEKGMSNGEIYHDAKVKSGAYEIQKQYNERMKRL